jgi:aspartyl/glutamyl-tRNA(Asn/Gln) amidotransferase C subunit
MSRGWTKYAGEQGEPASRECLNVILPHMPSEISKELFDHLVELAALELKPEEAEYIHQELNKQLKVIEELAAIPLEESTPLASHGVPYASAIQPPLRQDEIVSSGISQEILAETPETEANYIVVPEIPHETLE